MLRFETERLILRRFCEDDFEDYAKIFADAEVLRYVGEGKPLTRSQAWMSLATIFGHWQLRGYGMFAVEEKTSQVVVGKMGFLQPEGWPGFEIGWTLNRSYWGLGYATEGAKALLDYGFNQLQQKSIISLIAPENIKSIRVAERLGAKLEGKTEVYRREVLIYGHRREIN